MKLFLACQRPCKPHRPLVRFGNVPKKWVARENEETFATDPGLQGASDKEFLPGVPVAPRASAA